MERITGCWRNGTRADGNVARANLQGVMTLPAIVTSLLNAQPSTTRLSHQHVTLHCKLPHHCDQAMQLLPTPIANQIRVERLKPKAAGPDGICARLLNADAMEQGERLLNMSSI